MEIQISVNHAAAAVAAIALYFILQLWQAANCHAPQPKPHMHARFDARGGGGRKWWLR